MSIIVRAALLGGLAYVVSRAVKTTRSSSYLSHPDTRRLSREQEPDEVWPARDRASTSNL